MLLLLHPARRIAWLTGLPILAPVPGQHRGRQAARRLCRPGAGRVPFAEWAERWFNTTAALRHTTRRDYRKLLDQQVLPAFASDSLAGIDALAVRELVADLVAGGLSARRARKAYAVLSQVLASAVEGGRLTRNVAAGIKLPKVQRTRDALSGC